MGRVRANDRFRQVDRESLFRFDVRADPSGPTGRAGFRYRGGLLMTGPVVPRPSSRLGASGCRGVTWSASHNRWQCHISVGQGRKKFLGRFVHLADAIAALDIGRRIAAADALASAEADP